MGWHNRIATARNRQGASNVVTMVGRFVSRCHPQHLHFNRSPSGTRFSPADRIASIWPQIDKLQLLCDYLDPYLGVHYLDVSFLLLLESNTALERPATDAWLLAWARIRPGR